MRFFLYGEDTYRARQKLKQIEEKFKKTDKSRVNLVKIDGEKSSWKNIEKEILAPPFLHDKKLVVIESFLKKKGIKLEEAAVFLRQDKIPGGTIVVFWEEGSPDERTAIFKLLNKPEYAQKFDALSPIKLNQWILQRVKECGIEIEKKAALFLADLIGPDLWQMAGEIEKLAAYCRREKRDAKERGVITPADIGLLVRGKFDENIFDLTDALGNKNQRLVFKILNEQIEAGLKESYIFSMLVRQLRILFQVKEIVEKDYPFISPGDPTIRPKIASSLGLHPYVAAKTLYQIKNYTLAELKNIYSKMLAIDMKMKKTNLSPRLLLDLFIAEACLQRTDADLN